MFIYLFIYFQNLLVDINLFYYINECHRCHSGWPMIELLNHDWSTKLGWGLAMILNITYSFIITVVEHENGGALSSIYPTNNLLVFFSSIQQTISQFFF